MPTISGNDVLFSDDVITSTELNRRVGTVLDRAAIRPVTISRNNETFALLKREYAARMIRMLGQTQNALTLLAEVHKAMSGGEIPAAFAWLKVYEKDDLQRLVTEVFDSVDKASSGAEDWSYVDSIIHEWRESAEIATSGVLDPKIFLQGSEGEIPLINPEEVIRYDGLSPEVDG